MKRALPFILSLSLIPFAASAEVVFNKKTCDRILKGEGNAVCHKALKADPKAEYAMARFFGDPKNGPLVNLDYAFYWHIKLARQIVKNKLMAEPYTSTLYNTGVMYHDGLGTKQDLKKAFYWFKKAANRGDSLSMVRLALAYEKGIGTKKDETKSLQWLKKAVEKNNPTAKVSMAKHMIEGKGVKKDTVKAIEYLKDAAKLNSPQANFVLGNAYLTGRFVKKDMLQAKKHYGTGCRLNMLPACKRYYDIDSNSKELQAWLNSKPIN